MNWAFAGKERTDAEVTAMAQATCARSVKCKAFRGEIIRSNKYKRGSVGKVRSEVKS